MRAYGDYLCFIALCARGGRARWVDTEDETRGFRRRGSILEIGTSARARHALRRRRWRA